MGVRVLAEAPLAAHGPQRLGDRLVDRGVRQQSPAVQNRRHADQVGRQGAAYSQSVHTIRSGRQDFASATVRSTVRSVAGT